MPCLLSNGSSFDSIVVLSRLPVFIHRRLQCLLQSTKGRIRVGGSMDFSDRFIEPTIISDVSLEDPLMTEEIFGPLLPVVRVQGEDEALRIIKSRELTDDSICGPTFLLVHHFDHIFILVHHFDHIFILLGERHSVLRTSTSNVHQFNLSQKGSLQTTAPVAPDKKRGRDRERREQLTEWKEYGMDLCEDSLI
ncbi:unnamed protein product [Cyprideis torosa]|uniref:Aldehyde dehydrogenase domain-containing protein n=1 Tax=Cyprideis torosa TaxID=163714 RepID=A0A7R8ZJY2_9CRUS|nr:unnamed protein product [Cyprideis torosa]CAG0889571.1 unnamed protein product [Cyprideis torosa]